MRNVLSPTPTDLESPSATVATRSASSPLAAIYSHLLDTVDIHVNGPRPWDMQVHDPRLWTRLLWRGTRGLGEAYVAGWWDVEHLDQFFARVLRGRVDQRVWNLPKRMLDFVARLGNLQDISRARQVATHHYDLDSDLYRAMLGPSMVYTCAYWRTATTLDQAQEDKLDLVCRKLELEPGMRVLDVGCGWGGFARYAAEHYGVEVTGITIAGEQASFARELCRDLPVTIRTLDYRQIEGRFDRIVSLGMFEHVGRKNYPHYMQLIREHLTHDGIFVMQTIGLNDLGSGIDPWVTRYIFPNSEIPSVGRLSAAFTGHLKLEDWHNLGPDYDRTLLAWHANFCAAWPQLAERFEPSFFRQWSYYLLMFAGVFRARGLDLWQLVLTPLERSAQYRRPLT